MTEIPDSHRDLLDAQVATFATLGTDGLPQLTEVWFLADDGDVKISLSSGRVKTKNLRRNPACSLLIVDPKNPYRYLEIRGRARLDDDPEYAFAGRVGEKYGADVREYDQPGETRLVVTIEPAKVYAVDMSS